MRAECHDRLSIANGCSRDVVLSHVSAIQKHVFGVKINPKKKERTFDFNRYKTPPTVLKLPFQKMKGWNSFPKNALSSMCRRWLLLRWRREKICNNTTTKKRTQKGRNSPAQVKTPRTRTPFVRSFPALFIFHSFNLICHAGGEIQKRSICISKTERKQTMKKRAPTLPPTIIDRGLSMIAMRVTFSRACARARKKKVILYARANARKNAREKVKRKWKKNAFFRYRYKIHENSLSNF